eukprot:3429109-Amphidinium_carterae.1
MSELAMAQVMYHSVGYSSIPSATPGPSTTWKGVQLLHVTRGGARHVFAGSIAVGHTKLMRSAPASATTCRASWLLWAATLNVISSWLLAAPAREDRRMKELWRRHSDSSSIKQPPPSPFPDS